MTDINTIPLSDFGISRTGLGGTQDIQGKQEIQGKTVFQGESLVIEEPKGTFAIQPSATTPELQPPEGNDSSPEELGSTLNQLTGTNSGSSVMFLLSEIMKLLLECGKTERASARLERESAHQQVIKSIQSQADQMRDAAIAGLVLGLVSSAVSLCMTGASIKSSINSMTQLSGLNKQYGLDGIQPQLTETAGALKTANVQVENTSATLKQAANPLDADIITNLDTECANSVNSQPQQATLEQAQADLAARQNRVDELQAQLETKSQTLQNDNATLEDVNNQLEQARTELAQFEEALIPPEGNQLEDAQNKVNDLTQRQTQARQKVNESQEALAQANTRLEEAQGQRDAAATRLNGLQGDANARADVAIQDTKNQLATLKAEENPDQNAIQKMEYKLAKLENLKAVANQTTAQNDFNQAFGEYKQAETLMKADPKYQAAVDQRIQADQNNVLNQQIGNALNAIAQKTGEIMNAEATRKGAAVEEAKNAKDMAQDWFSQAADIINGALDTMRAVLRTEGQTNQTIIQA